MNLSPHLGFHCAVLLIFLSAFDTQARTLKSIAYGNGIFVAAGNDRTILTSTDAVNWVDQTIVVTNAVNINFTTETYRAGEDSLTLVTPDDPSSELNTSQDTFQFGRAVGFGNNMFVILGASGEIVISQDGELWRSIVVPASANLNAIAWGQNEFVVVGDAGTILTSSDGIKWSLANSGTDKKLLAVAFGNGVFVAVGGDKDNSIILTSKDGITWTPNPANYWDPISAVAFGNNEFMASAPEGIDLAMVSPDGEKWQRVVHSPIMFIGLDYCKDRFVALGHSTQPCSSVDGINWQPQLQQRKYGDGYDSCSAAYGNGVYVAVGRELTVSKDGIHWEKSTMPISKLLYGYEEIKHRLIYPPSNHRPSYAPLNHRPFDTPSERHLPFGVLTTPLMPPLYTKDGQTWSINVDGTDIRISGNVNGNEIYDAHRIKAETRNHQEFAVLSSDDGITWTRLQPTATTKSAVKIPTIASVAGPEFSDVGIVIQLNGQSYRLDLSAQVRQVYQLQASTNLEDWVNITTMTNNGNMFNFTDPDVAKYPQRFYRLKLQP